MSVSRRRLFGLLAGAAAAPMAKAPIRYLPARLHETDIAGIVNVAGPWSMLDANCRSFLVIEDVRKMMRMMADFPVTTTIFLPPSAEMRDAAAALFPEWTLGEPVTKITL